MKHSSQQPMHFETQLIHAGAPEERFGQAVTLPIFQTSTFEFTGETSYDAIKYGRLSNSPNHESLHQKIAQIEGAEAVVVAASGMAAISTTLLSLLRSGDHLLIQDQIYGGTFGFLTEDLPRWGITFDFVNGQKPETWASHIRSNTKLIYTESVSNPLLQVLDLAKTVAFARGHRLISVIDNTFLSPVNLRPIEWGFDIVVHSATKYLNGHSDICAGVVAGRKDLVQGIHHLLNHLGGSLDPHAAFLLDRGIKTLALRVRQQNHNALMLSRFLDSHPHVQRVYYPKLESHPNHALMTQFKEGVGGVFSFEVRGDTSFADRTIANLHLAISAPSLGGVETLITRPATTSHAALPPETRARIGIQDNLIRVAVGIESVEDLIADFDQALQAAAQ
jgi:cystathionine beta-lyase/cystathionine gamma-synthase